MFSRSLNSKPIAAEEIAADETLTQQTIKILEMIAIGAPTSEIYDSIALLYESKYPGLRCSMLELRDGILYHGGAPSLPKSYCDAVNGLAYGPNIGSCGTATYTGERCIVENIETDPKWADIKHVALPHGMRCCWSEPIKNSQGKVLGAFGMYYNHPAKPSAEESADLLSAARLAGFVMERDHNQKQIRELAYLDTLTKLPSRARFFYYMNDLISASKKHKRKFNLLFLDIDDFKHINDTQGHDAGDHLLKILADRLSLSCQDADFIARIGGDEFCLVTEECIDSTDPQNLAQRCIEAISEKIQIGNVIYKPSCSIGIASYPKDGDSISCLLKAADIALYSAKDKGKSTYKYFEKKLMQQAEYKFYFEKSLKEAIEQNQIHLHFQPKIDTLNHKVIGVEALARWEHPKFGQIRPNEFIEVAEQIGVIKDLTAQILHMACQQIADWRKSQNIDLEVSVNISPPLFLNKDIIKLVKEVVEDTGIAPEMLELEVTENVVQTDIENLEIFQEIKNLGIKLAIDDFGIGYSSFASLKHVKIDCIKIDKYFIHDMLEDESSKHIISSMISIGENFGYKIVAEGVERKEELELLKSLGCSLVQGFYFCKPLSPDNFLAWYRTFHTS